MYKTFEEKIQHFQELYWGSYSRSCSLGDADTHKPASFFLKSEVGRSVPCTSVGRWEGS